MNPTTQKVLTRLIHEKLLHNADLTPRRLKITLDEALQAAREEPRIYEVLAAILLNKPTIFYKLHRDLPKHPGIKNFVNNLFDSDLNEEHFFGIEKLACQKAATHYRKFLDQKKSKQKFLTMTLRLGKDDIERLKWISEKLGLSNLSETIRLLAKEKIEKGL